MINCLDAAEVHKGWLNSISWPQSFTAEIPEDLQPPADPSYYAGALRCIVLPREDEYVRKTRDAVAGGVFDIDTFLAVHLDTMPARDVNEVAHAIVQKLIEVPAALDCGFIQGVRRVLWLPDHLQDKRIFGTVVTVTIDMDSDQV